MKKANDGQLVLLGEENSGRDEMNLAGNPFALLQAASRNGQSFIKNEWERTLPNGRVVMAKWEVNGHAELGLPGPNEEMLYLVLLQITRESADAKGVWPQKVHFSRGRILELLKWSDSAATYKLLSECLTRLSNVQINAVNAFWDAKAKMPYEAISFGLINEFALARETHGRKGQGNVPRSWFEWNKTVYESFLAGNVRSLALDFALSLELPTTRRLFRYLDMMRSASTPPRPDFTIGLFKLSDKLGMTSYKYASKVKEKLKPAVEELKERGFLNEVHFDKSKDGTDRAIFIFNAIKPDLGTNMANASSNPKKNRAAQEMPLKPQQMALLEEIEKKDVRADAIRCSEVFQSLSESERNELLKLARKEVNPIWHDRVGQPESPMSLGLWQLVAARYPERLK